MEKKLLGGWSQKAPRTSSSTPVPPTSSHKTRPNVTLPLYTSRAKGSQTRSGTVEPPGNRPCREHSFLTDVADVRQMEQGLLKLLDDFHSGKLQAFGQDCSFEKMDQVREQQERLAKLHFELDGQQEMRGFESTESRETANKNLGKLMENLQELCTSIHNLQKGDQPMTQSASHS